MVRVWAFRTVFKIRCKSFLVYFGTARAEAGMTVTGNFIPRNLAGWLKNSDLGNGEKSRRVTKGHFGQKWPRP